MFPQMKRSTSGRSKKINALISYLIPLLLVGIVAGVMILHVDEQTRSRGAVTCFIIKLESNFELNPFEPHKFAFLHLANSTLKIISNTLTREYVVANSSNSLQDMLVT